MSLKTTLTLVISTLFLSLAAKADEPQDFNPDELLKASSVAIAAFKSASPDHVQHLSGFKTWKSGTEAKVKIYITHDGMNMENNYLCHKMNNDIHCSAQ